MRLEAVAITITVSLAACSQRSSPRSDTADASVPVAVVATIDAAPAVDAAPTVPTFHTAYAHLEKDVLTACMELTFEGELDAGLSVDTKMQKQKDWTHIKKGCATQFADRTVLATCSGGNTTDAGTGSVVMNYYSFESVGLNDREMQDCLARKADWNALSRESAEWNRAKLDYHQRKLHGVMQQSGVEQ